MKKIKRRIKVIESQLGSYGIELDLMWKEMNKLKKIWNVKDHSREAVLQKIVNRKDKTL